jgi:integrase
MQIRCGTYYYIQPISEKWINLGRHYVRAMTKYAQLTRTDAPSETVSELGDRYLVEVALMKAPRTYQDNVNQMKFLRAFFGSMRIEDVTQQDIYQYMSERGKSSQVQANREIALLSHMFKKAVRWGDIHPSENPCIGIERFKETPRDRYVEDAELEAFKAHAGAFIAAYIDFKLLTALRQGDVLSLRLDQLKDDGIHVTVGKTGKRVIIEWSEALRDAVTTARQLPRPVRGFYLFCNRKGQPYTGNGFRSIWQRRMKSALEKGILKERFREHDLRAKAASDAKKDHATELLAHLDSRTTSRHYRRKPEVIRPLK